ncbi:hypothetical protein PENTCL1PPCAC_26567, partial [Pristionchus entomophagus]
VFKMPLWKIDFADINSETKIPADIDDDEILPEGYNEEFEKVDNFVAENLKRAKETKDVEMIGFVVEQGISRYTRLGLKKDVLDEQIWITRQLGKGFLQNFHAEAKGAQLKTEIAFVMEMIADQKKKEPELRHRIASLRAERDLKKAKLETVIRSNRSVMNEVSHITKRHALIKERLRLDTIEYDQEKALRDDLRETFVGYSEDLDLQLQNAPWLVEKQKEAARRKKLEDEIKILEADIEKIDRIEERNRIAEESERDLPFKQFCVQLAELYVKREKVFKQLAEEKANVKRLEEEKINRRAIEDSSQMMDCTQAILDGDLDDEETLLKIARHYKIDTQNPNVPMSQKTQDSQMSQPLGRKRTQSPAESTASSEANDTEMSDGGEETPVPPPTKRVSIIEPIANLDESVDEAISQIDTQQEANLDDSQMEEDEQNGDRSQPEQMETEEREEEEEEEEEREEIEEEVEEEREEVEEEEQMEQQGQEESPGTQESQVTVASQESAAGYVPEEVEEQEEVEENDGFRRPLKPMKMAPVAVEENEEAETSFNPEMMLNISANSNDPGGDFFDMMNKEATWKRAVVDASGGSPAAAAGNDDFMSMFGGGDGGGGESGAADGGDAGSFSFNFGGGGDANETGGGSGGEFNFFGF